jgi:hypothetical protein
MKRYPREKMVQERYQYVRPRYLIHDPRVLCTETCPPCALVYCLFFFHLFVNGIRVADGIGV